MEGSNHSIYRNTVFWQMTVGELLKWLTGKKGSNKMNDGLVLWGAPGFGKSTVVDAALKVGFHSFEGDILSILVHLLANYNIDEIRDLRLSDVGSGRTTFFRWGDSLNNKLIANGTYRQTFDRWFGSDYKFDVIGVNWAYDRGHPTLVLPVYDVYKRLLRQRDIAMVAAGMVSHEIMGQDKFYEYCRSHIAEGKLVLPNFVCRNEDLYSDYILGFLTKVQKL